MAPSLRVPQIVLQTGAVRVMLRPLQGNLHRYHDKVQFLNHLCEAIQTVLSTEPKFQDSLLVRPEASPPRRLAFRCLVKKFN